MSVTGRVLFPLTLCLSVLVAAASASTAPRWRQIVAPHFVVIGDASPSAMRGVAEQLEQFRAIFERLLQKARVASPVPTRVYLFANRARFQPYMPVYKGKRVDVGGLFLPGRDANAIAMTVEDEQYALPITYHEYVHFIVDNTLTAVPVWFNEGLAEYYSTFVLVGGNRAELGRPVANHVQLLRERSMMPLAELFATTKDSPHYNEGDKRSIFYAQSWVFMHYLLMGSPERRPQLFAFVAELARRVPPTEAFRNAFGAEPATLERELRRYVHNLSFKYELVTLRDPIVPDSLGEGQPVEEADVEALLGELLLRVGRTEEAVARLDRCVAQFPASGAVLASRALADVHRSDYVAAAPQLARAAALAPRDERVLFWNGVASYMVLATAGSQAIDERERAAREAIDRALVLRPDSPDLLAMLASLDARNPDTQVRARDRWLHALQLAPTRADYALGLAAVLIALGDQVAARNLLGPLAGAHPDEGVRTRARNLLAQSARADLDKREAATEGARPPATEGADLGARGGRFIPVLRELGAGEERGEAMFEAVECASSRFVAVFLKDGQPFRLWFAAFDKVDFVSYDQGASLPPITCGPRPRHEQVLVTWRAGKQPSTDGDLVAVEFLPQQPR